MPEIVVPPQNSAFAPKTLNIGQISSQPQKTNRRLFDD
jgi:hypothetical protein